jgi:cytoskeletal protein CcmA (bactofilin family)
MSIFQKPSPEIALEDTAPTSHTPEDTIETVVGPSVHVEGDFASAGNILVKGTVSGNVTTSRLLTVEEGAKIFANVKAGDAFVSGEIQGNLKVKERVELTASARVAGDISCAILVVEAGALILGKVSMKGINQHIAKIEKKSSPLKRKKKRSAKSEATGMVGAVAKMF